jgi:hypothetical protein
MSAGRPTDYCQETAAILCTKLVEGKSLRSICLDPDMPSISTVFLWLGKHAEFMKQYDMARDSQADTLADEMLDIADDGSNDWMERSQQRGGGYELNGEHVQRSRLRLDTRKWIASKLKPKRYGEKIEQLHVGDKDRPIMLTPVDADI